MAWTLDTFTPIAATSDNPVTALHTCSADVGAVILRTAPHMGISPDSVTTKESIITEKIESTSLGRT